jgi:hypothetical protein
MFESYQEAERNSGFKGFIARHFGPVIYADVAEEGIRQIGIVFMVLAVFSGIVSLRVSGNAWSLGAGLVLAAVALVLYFTKSRTTAVILLVLSLTNALLVLPALIPWIWVLFAVRATQLTFGYHRLRKTRTEVLSAME